MATHPQAGQPATAGMLIDPAQLERDYRERRPDMSLPAQQVSFGTSGHRGTPLNSTFTESHIQAITQAICEYRVAQGITGRLFLGKDTHAVSRAAQRRSQRMVRRQRFNNCCEIVDLFR